MPVSSSTEHWIRPDALKINLNHFGDPDYLQVSLLAGAVVMAFKQDVISYNAAHNYRTWPLQAANTYLETSSAYHVYARLTRSEENASALVVYDPVLRDIEGREITYAVNEETGEQVEVPGEPSDNYFYIFLGKLSSSLNDLGKNVLREWESPYRAGTLDSSEQKNDIALIIEKMFVPHFNNPLDPTELTWIEAKANMGVAGGVTSFINNGKFDLPSIYDGLPVDNQTLKWKEYVADDGSKVKVLVAEGGGEGKLKGIEVDGNGNAITSVYLADDGTKLMFRKDKEFVDKAYLDSNFLNKELAEKAFVSLATEQTITGKKDFTGGLLVNGKELIYNAELGFWELNGDLLVSGGISSFSSSTAYKPSTIMDGVIVDGVTIKKNDSGALYFAGSIDGPMSWDNLQGKPSWLTDAKPVYEWNEISERPTRLSQFTDDVVRGEYLPLSGGTVSGHFGIFNPNGAIAFTNSSQYQSAALAYSGGSNWMVTDNEWLYYYTIIHSGNIGSQSVNYANESGITGGFGCVITNIDLNNLSAPMFWNYGQYGANTLNAPIGFGFGAGIQFKAVENVGLVGQFVWDVNHGSATPTNNLWFRASNNLGFGNDWKEIAFTDSNVASATKLANKRYIWGQEFDGTGDVSGDITELGNLSTHNSYRNIHLTLNTDSRSWLVGVGLSDGDDKFAILDRTMGVERLVIDTAGNVGVGTMFPDAKLDVNGSAVMRGDTTVSGNLIATGGVVTTDIHGNGSNLYLGNIGNPAYVVLREDMRGVDETWYVYKSGDAKFGELSASSLNVSGFTTLKGDLRLRNGSDYFGSYLYFGEDNNCYIAEYTDNVMMISANNGITLRGYTTVSGDLLVTGGITMYSQRSLKEIVDRRGLSLHELAAIIPTRYTWKDKRDERVHIGGIADEVMEVLPEVIYKTSDGILTMDYGNAAFAIAASLINPVCEHERRISELERENKELKREIERMKIS